MFKLNYYDGDGDEGGGWDRLVRDLEGKSWYQYAFYQIAQSITC